MTGRATAQSVTRELVSRVELGASVEPEWTVGPIDRGGQWWVVGTVRRHSGKGGKNAANAAVMIQGQDGSPCPCIMTAALAAFFPPLPLCLRTVPTTQH